MATLTGILVDVSGSMRENAVGISTVEKEGGAWVRSIFKVIDDLIKHDVSSNNHVFAIGVGASCEPEIFDVIKTVEQFQGTERQVTYKPQFDVLVDQLLTTLEENGARTVRKWLTVNVIHNCVSYDLLLLFLNQMRADKKYARAIVEGLPPQCKKTGFREDIASLFIKADEIQILEVVKKALSELLKDIDAKSIFNVQQASNIIHGCVGESELSNDRIKNLMKIVDPFIYGRTPLFKSLKEASKLLLKTNYTNHKKLLFVLSDGEPTDNGDLTEIVAKLQNADVTVVGCYITRSTTIESKRLYSDLQPNWDEGAQFLFNLSSKVTTQLLPRTIFIKRGWNIDIKNNETKLFLQINHPDIIGDACDLAKNVVCCQDALCDVFSSVPLDIYINQSTTGFQAKKQERGTCYANASAAVLHLAMKRILGRDGGYPDFYRLRQEMIDHHGWDGANTFGVLQQICPKYRLRCQQDDVIGALKAVTAKRPVVATFRLTDDEWKIFSEFYKRNPRGVLTKKELDINKINRSTELGGHAVVLTSYNSECLRFMNSWGMDWGDVGFFKVEDAKVLDVDFIDVFWTLNDLNDKEKAYYQQHGKEVADQLMTKLTGLQSSTYECPLCRRLSYVTEFTGTLSRATCPKCRNVFQCDETGNILALNIYLTSLSW